MTAFAGRVALAGGALALTLAIAVRPAIGQQASDDAPRGSRFIATTDWMTDAVSRLRGRGYFALLSPLSRPWERLAVARGLLRIPIAALDTMPRHVAQSIRLLRLELGPELLRLEGRETRPLGFIAWAGMTHATSPRTDPMFPLRSGIPRPNGQRGRQAPWSNGGGGGWGELGAWAVDLQIGYDLALRRGDPDGNFPERIFDALPDNEVSYVSGRFAHGGLVLGRLRRNWAPPGSNGLMVSDVAIGQPQVGWDLGTRSLVVRGFVSELDTLFGRERYFVAHRIEYLRDDFAISLGESKTYGSRSGPLLSSFNPVEIFFLTGSRVDGEQLTNTALDGQFWLRRGRLTLSGETFVDDVWIYDRAPMRIAVSAGSRYFGPAQWLELGLDYRFVASFTYWTLGDSVGNSDRMTFHGRGLGDAFSDYDRVTLHANVYPGPAGLRLTPTVARQRKGEWDFRKPGLIGWEDRPHFLQGVVESMTRFAIAGRYQRTRDAFFEWDAGVNLVTNADHIVGRNLSEFGAMARIGVLWSALALRAP